MAAAPTGLPDWRDPAGYVALLDADRAVHAWEWLRRQPDYRNAAASQIRERLATAEGLCAEEGAAAPWGLHAFEDPALPAPAARPVWRHQQHSLVLVAAAEPAAAGPDAFSLAQLPGLATIVTAADGQHLLLSNGMRQVRVDLSGASLRSGPARLAYKLSGMEAVTAPLLVLRRLLALLRGGRFSRALHPPDPRARRLLLLLRTFDAIQAGADQRAIAAILLDRDAAGARWRVTSSAARSQAQRLVRTARAMAAGRWQGLL